MKKTVRVMHHYFEPHFLVYGPLNGHLTEYGIFQSEGAAEKCASELAHAAPAGTRFIVVARRTTWETVRA